MSATRATRASLPALAAALALAAPAGAAAAAPEQPEAFAAGAGFERVGLAVRERKLFDLGVTDYNRDGRLDIFTLNHKFLSTFKVATAGGFADRLAPLGLNQSPGFPGLENLFKRPRLTEAGAHLYLDEHGRMHLVGRRLDEIASLPQPRVSGRVTFHAGAVEVQRRRLAEVSSRRVPGSEPPLREVDFTLRSGGHVILEPPHVDLPIAVSLAPELPRSRAFVGVAGVHPAASEFELTLSDRHGVVWADLGGDDKTDAFIVRGGLAGNISRFNGVIEDELLVQGTDGVFRNQTDGSGLVKGPCRARAAQAVDFNGDGRLDLFSSCKDARPRLYERRPNGSFAVSSPALRGVARMVRFTWVDLDQDRRPELIGAGKRRVNVYRRRGDGSWARSQSLRSFSSSGQVAAILPAAIDGDSDPDLLVVAGGGNTVALNRNGRLRRKRPRHLGLPRRSLAGSWVDHDNNGTTDLHLVPQGLYERRRGRLRFRATGMMRGRGQMSWAVETWADLDNDGDRDALIGYKRPRSRVDVVRYRNRTARRWLQVELTGAPGNRPALGSRVMVKTRGGRQYGWVGESEGSRYSQGHHRLYFGLGRARRAELVTVRWPNGSRTRLENVSSNRRLEVAFGA